MRTFITTAAAVLIASTACGQYKTSQPSATAVQTTTVAPQNGTLTPVPAQSLDDARRIKRDDAIKMIKDGKAVFIDVRPKTDYDALHIKGAINIPLAELPQRWRDLPRNKFLITYCA
jgi:3-mercaptopyruvate sulfurtransferase SseA